MKEKGKSTNQLNEFTFNSIDEINQFGLTVPKKHSKKVDKIFKTQEKIIFDFGMMHFQTVEGIYLCEAIPIQ
ncbi:MAG: hypothetical protein E7153_06395 [Enterococcus faecium]|nr:hypothetical protein [Enterococcus faecium]